MVVLGLAQDKKKSKAKNKKKSSDSQADEAKELLEQMEAKKKANPDDCVFC